MVGAGAELDHVATEGEAVGDGCAEARAGEGIGPAGERLVGSDGDAVLLLALGQDLEKQFSAAAIEFDVAQPVGERVNFRNGDKVAAAEPADLALDSALLMGAAGAGALESQRPVVGRAPACVALGRPL